MKKLVLVLLVGTMSVFLASCSGNSKKIEGDLLSVNVENSFLFGKKVSVVTKLNVEGIYINVWKSKTKVTEVIEMNKKSKNTYSKYVTLKQGDRFTFRILKDNNAFIVGIDKDNTIGAAPKEKNSQIKDFIVE